MFDMPGHTYKKLWYQILGNFHVYLNANNQLYPLFFYLDIKMLQSCYFGYFGHVWSQQPVLTVSNFDVYLHVKNTLNLSILS